MKTMKSFVLSIFITALAIPVIAQTMSDIFAAYTKGTVVAVNRTADDTDPMILVKYVGTNASGLVAVAAGGDITFTTGALSSEAADTSLECPVSGALGGVIDVSDAACDTVGEVVDIINGSSNWVAVPVASLRTDSSNDTITTISATQAKTVKGLALTADTTVALTSTILLAPSNFSLDIGTYLAGSSMTAVALKVNPFINRTFLASSRAVSTYGSGTSFHYVYEVTPTFKRVGASEVVNILHGPIAGGATTVLGNLVTLSDNNRIMSNPNSKLLVRVVNSAAMATVGHYNMGYYFPPQ